MADTGKTVVKAVQEDDGEWMLDILGVPFGSPESKDADGEWFDQATRFHEDKFAEPVLVHYHGFDDHGKPSSTPEYIGRTVKRWTDQAGVWFRATLDKTSERAKALWEAAKQGVLRASSGSVSHLARKGPDGHIEEWPVVEVSLLDISSGKRPANSYAVAMPAAKQLYAKAGVAWPDNDAPEADPEAGRDPAASAEYQKQVTKARLLAIDILYPTKET